MRSIIISVASSRLLPRSNSHLLLRALLILGAVGSVAIALALISPSPAVFADPALARLLRGMALIKAVITIAAAAAVFWRMGRPTSPAVAAGYLGSIWLMAGADVSIWQLTAIGPAAVAFHSALIGLLVVAWRDDRAPLLGRLGSRGIAIRRA